jgi:hypothetical protein
MSKLTINMLENMIKQIMNEKAKIPTLQPITKQLDSAQPIINFDLVFSGKNTQDQKILTDIALKLNGGTDLVKTLTNLQNFFDPSKITATIQQIQDLDSDGQSADDQISYLFSSILAISALKHITTLDQSAMGFYLESWFTMVIAGERSGGEGEAADFWVPTPSGDNVLYSSKFIVPSSTISQVSAKRATEDITYIIAEKDSASNIKQLQFYVMKALFDTTRQEKSASGVVKNGILEVPMSNLLGGGYSLATYKNNNTNWKSLITIDLQNIEQQLQNIEAKLNAQLNNAASLIFDFVENMDALKILLGYYYQTYDNTVPTDIKSSAENCKAIVDTFQNDPSFTKIQTANITATAADIVNDNIELLEAAQLPDITTNQAYNMLARAGDNNADSVLNKVAENIQGNTFEEVIKSFCDYFNDLITNTKTLSTQQDLQQAFSVLIAAQSIYRIMEEAMKGEEKGSAGFSLENFASIFLRAAGNVSGVFGGNSEVADLVEVDGNTLKGYSSKLHRSHAANAILRNLFADGALKKSDLDAYDPNLFAALGKPKTGDKSWKKGLGQAATTGKTMRYATLAKKAKKGGQSAQEAIDTVLNRYPGHSWGGAEFKTAEISKSLEDNKSISANQIKDWELYAFTAVHSGRKSAEKAGDALSIRSFNDMGDVSFYLELSEIGKIGKKGSNAKAKNKFIASLKFSETNFDDFVKNMANSLTKSNRNFMETFRFFNQFKMATYSFFQNPDAGYLTASIAAYDKMKASINKTFGADPNVGTTVSENKFKELDLMIEHMVKYLLIGEKYD